MLSMFEYLNKKKSLSKAIIINMKMCSNTCLITFPISQDSEFKI